MAHSFVAFLFVVVEQDDEELGGGIKVCLLGKGRRLLTFYLLEEYWVLIFFPSI
jgi:hypothetical protein